jgi:uncharacterized protein YbjT (DUF2867 family)
MKVVVFGATERLGGLLVAGALGRGHTVTAFGPARPAPTGPAKDPAGGRLQTVPGDLVEGAAVAAAVAGHDAVLYALEPPSGRGPTTRASQGMRNVVRAMSDGGVRRLICLSIGGPGTERVGDPPGLVKRLFRASPPSGALADLRKTEVTVRQSGLDWTIVRAARLTDDEGRHRHRTGPGYALPHGTKIARADVAEFMLDQLDDVTNVGHAVAIAW